MRGLRIVFLFVVLVVIIGASATAWAQNNSPYTAEEKAVILKKFGEFCTEPYYSDPHHSPELHYCTAGILFDDLDKQSGRKHAAKISTLNFETGEMTISCPISSPPRSFWPNPARLDKLTVQDWPRFKDEI